MKKKNKLTNVYPNIFVSNKLIEYFMNEYICQQIFKYIVVSKYLLHMVSKLKDKAYFFFFIRGRR